ncbi:MAG: alkaline phosphatase [Limisphaerales bacterium]|jgi:alkaline phosphatase
MNRICVLAITLFVLQGCNNRDLASTKAPTATNPKNIIFMVGDGMGISQITAGMYANGNKTVFERFKTVGLHKTHSSDNIITDSAAGATAFSCGEKTYNGAIAVNDNREPIKTIFEECDERNIKTGLAVSCTVTHATPACFYAHNESRSNYEEIAFDLASSNVNVAIGYGLPQFNERVDQQDLLTTMKDTNWEVYDNLEAVPSGTKERLAVLLPTADPPRVADRPENYLSDATIMALDQLNPGPFMLVIEGAQIDWGGHANDSEYIISEMIDFDETVNKVLDWAEKDGNTLVIVTADHETGGYAINGGRMDSMSTAFTTGHHTAQMVPIFAHGPGAELFAGVYENTEIYEKLLASITMWGEKPKHDQ